jgi:hypothetical protein
MGKLLMSSFGTSKGKLLGRDVMYLFWKEALRVYQ